MRGVDLVLGRYICRQCRLDDHEPYVLELRERNLCEHGERSKLQPLVNVRGGHVRQHIRYGIERSPMLRLSERHILLEYKPKRMHSARFVRGRDRANRLWDCNESAHVHPMPGRNVLPGRHNR